MFNIKEHDLQTFNLFRATIKLIRSRRRASPRARASTAHTATTNRAAALSKAAAPRRTRFDLKALGLDVPWSLLARADQAVEQEARRIAADMAKLLEQLHR